MYEQTLRAGGGEKEEVYVVGRGGCCGSIFKKTPKKEQDQRVADVAVDKSTGQIGSPRDSNLAHAILHKPSTMSPHLTLLIDFQQNQFKQELSFYDNISSTL